MTITALSSAVFDDEAKSDLVGRGWRAPDGSSVVRRSTSDSAAWPVDRKEITLHVHASSTSSAWLQRAVQDLGALLALGPNWNGYGEQAVHPSSVKRVVRVLDEIGYRGEAPSFVPLPDGGVQVEWHRGDASIEVSVPPAGHAHAFTYGVPEEDREWIVNQRSGLEQLAAALEELLGD